MPPHTSISSSSTVRCRYLWAAQMSIWVDLDMGTYPFGYRSHTHQIPKFHLPSGKLILGNFKSTHTQGYIYTQLYITFSCVKILNH